MDEAAKEKENKNSDLELLLNELKNIKKRKKDIENDIQELRYKYAESNEIELELYHSIKIQKEREKLEG